MKLKYILPFMESKELKELAVNIINGEVKGVKLVIVFPFLSNSDLDEIVELLLEKKDGKNLTYSLPFVSSETIDKIYEGIKSGEIEGVKEKYLYPFLSQDKLRDMFNHLVSEATENACEDEEDDEDEVLDD